ncbi:MAG: Aldehyde Dehydrogenase [Nocardioides sp.]|nr:Aldehyde Dehydrogenase [Nocardioides sp.]
MKAADHPDTTADQLEDVLSKAAAAAGPLATMRPSERAVALEHVAAVLDGATQELVPLAMAESHLPEGRLRGELTRTTEQLRMFARVAREGGYLEAVIDTVDPHAPMAPRPDLRRFLIPVGPVVVFAASNFPFAFSVAGGDTASALAAGCPVVLKAHPGHPQLSLRVAELVVQALAEAGAPEGALALVYGREAGLAALRDPRVQAGSFTGSIRGGRALFDVAAARPQPIPFYGEMGSVNPVFVTPGALRARAAEIVQGFVDSFTLGVGQFCTKPGYLVLPAGHGCEAAMTAALQGVQPARMLSERIADGYADVRAVLDEHPGTRTLVRGGVSEAGQVSPTLLATTVAQVLRHPETLLQECFGPTSVLVEYGTTEEMQAAAAAFAGNLTATVHAEPAEAEMLRPLLAHLVQRAGRLIWNAWPTGVAVTEAMHHGGPYPATSASLHTSVGSTAIRRFLRPIAYQSFPESLLPEALRDSNDLGIPRRVDSHVTAAPLPGAGHVVAAAGSTEGGRP